MDHTVDRDSDSMRSFATFLQYFSDEMDFYCSDLNCNCSAASDMMQDSTGEEALTIISSMIEEIRVQVYASYGLAERIVNSAKMIDASNECI